MVVLNQFFEYFDEVMRWFRSMCADFISNIWGSASEVRMQNVLFLVALIPAIITFGMELIFSFILSFRFRRFVFYVPFRHQLRSSLNKPINFRYHDTQRVRSLVYISRSKRENIYLKPRTYSFVRVDSSVNYKPVSKVPHNPIYRRSNDTKYSFFRFYIPNFLTHAYFNLRYKLRKKNSDTDD